MENLWWNLKIIEPHAWFPQTFTLQPYSTPPGWWFQPTLKNEGLRHLEWWNSQLWKIKVMFETTNQYIYIYIALYIGRLSIYLPYIYIYIPYKSTIIYQPLPTSIFSTWWITSSADFGPRHPWEWITWRYWVQNCLKWRLELNHWNPPWHDDDNFGVRKKKKNGWSWLKYLKSSAICAQQKTKINKNHAQIIPGRSKCRNKTGWLADYTIIKEPSTPWCHLLLTGALQR